MMKESKPGFYLLRQLEFAEQLKVAAQNALSVEWLQRLRSFSK